MPAILVVCTGNICRSPVVEGFLRYRLSEQGLVDWEVSSAGTWTQPGLSASANSVQLMAEQGIDISEHESREISEKMLEDADLVLCMETGHAEALRAEFPRNAHKVHLLSEMSGPNYSIADPYGGSREAYEQMVREVTELIDAGLPRIIQLAQANERAGWGE